MQLFRYFKKQDAWGLEVKTCGYYHSPIGESYPPAGHPGLYAFDWEAGRRLQGFHIIYIASGSGTFESENNPLKSVQAGDIIHVYENEWHRYRPNANSGWEEYWVGFDGDYFRDHILEDIFPEFKSHVIQAGYQDNIILSIEHILQVSKQNSPQLNKVLSGSVLNLLGLLVSLRDIVHPEKNINDIIDQSHFILRQHLTKPVDLVKLAQKFGMSYSGYRKLFKSKTGMALNQFIIKERIALAQRMLRNTSLSLNEIADKCGFDTLYYFSRMYKQKMGYKPSDERRGI